MKNSSELIVVGSVLIAIGGLILAIPRWRELFLNWPSPLYDLGVTIWFLADFFFWTTVPLLIFGTILILWGFLAGRKTGLSTLQERSWS